MLKLEHQPWLQYTPGDRFPAANPLEQSDHRIAGPQLLEHLSLGMNPEKPTFLAGSELPFNALEAGRWSDFIISGQNTEGHRAVEA